MASLHDPLLAPITGESSSSTLRWRCALAAGFLLLAPTVLSLRSDPRHLAAPTPVTTTMRRALLAAPSTPIFPLRALFDGPAASRPSLAAGILQAKGPDTAPPRVALVNGGVLFGGLLAAVAAVMAAVLSRPRRPLASPITLTALTVAGGEEPPVASEDPKPASAAGDAQSSDPRDKAERLAKAVATAEASRPSPQVADIIQVPKPDASEFEETLDKVGRVMNDTFRQWLPESVRQFIEVQPAGAYKRGPLGGFGPLAGLIAAPESPGLPRPAWLVALGALPTGFVWYNYYKFAVEEEVYQAELKRDGRVQGCGGFGTMLPFAYLTLLGLGAENILHVEGGESLLQVAGVWFVATQFNLYRRVNRLCAAPDSPPPLFAWWAVLPPPFNLVVGLRQAHFLAKHQAEERREAWETDPIAEEWFPFASRPRFTVREFLRTPSMWCSLLKDQKELDLPLLKDPPSSFV